MLLIHELVYVLLVLYFSTNLAISIILIRREYWCLLLYIILLIVDIQIIIRIVSILLLSKYNYYIKTLLVVDILSRF